MNPRKPTEEEKKEIIAYLLEHDFENNETERENVEGYVENAAIAVFDDYITGGPGYSGKVMVVVYDGGPNQTETYSWNSLDGKIERDVAINEA
ncbi:MAG TPA: hypothetical protein VE090_02785 [Methylomirabilota bacterium]|nr:hypothetical protein [Methylomirabilota bacterium]